MNESVDGSDRGLSLSISHHQLRLHYPSTPTLLYPTKNHKVPGRCGKPMGFCPPAMASLGPGAAEQSGAMATVAPKRASGRCSSLREIMINRCPDLRSPTPWGGVDPRFDPRKMACWEGKMLGFKMVRFSMEENMEHMIG